MSGGSNGLSPIVNLGERQKCADAPTKKRFTSSDEAWAEARKRSDAAGLPIAPYACSSCGGIHLTKKVDGSDVLTRQDGALVVTGSQRRIGRNHPVFSKPVERVTLPEPEPTEPPIPGNRDARLKVLRAWLSEGQEPTSREVSEVLGGSVARDTARDLMRHLGYRNTGGRSARWVRKDASTQERPQAAAQGSNGAPADERTWRTLLTAPVEHMTVGDLIAAYRAYGVELRIQGSDG
ncbi:helix-turn-helix DNA binding protein [Microbacterium phage Megan]|uniref:Helix-turn-helix DNA binding protein n=1 Tax=Microbacterium phage Megan TaxID=2656551 RepID=A0A649VKL0_9CAUD|nr:helix-turn-helix DNA binding protein [Microbacterium phage Megan]QGJ92734.1 helix-turn-helix DNA binding protein [Microbacterium phage Megan]